MSAAIPQRLTAMHHAQLEQGAVMSDADGWRLPAHYGDVPRESAWLRETVGVSDISPAGKLRVVGDGAAQAVKSLWPQAAAMPTGSVSEADSPPERGGKLLAARLAPDEFLLLTPPGDAPSAVAALPARENAPCAYIVDVTSGLAGVALSGPATQKLMSRITDADVSPRSLPNLACLQSRFAEIQGLLLRRDVGGIPVYQLYVGREFGEYLWETLIEAARESGGGPAGTEALGLLRDNH